MKTKKQLLVLAYLDCCIPIVLADACFVYQRAFDAVANLCFSAAHQAFSRSDRKRTLSNTSALLNACYDRLPDCKQRLAYCKDC